MTRRRIAVWALAVGASGVACGQASKRDGSPRPGGSGGYADPSGTGTGGRTAGTGGTGSAGPSDGGAGADQNGGAAASGGTPGGDGGHVDADATGRGSGGAGGAGGAAKVMEPYFRAGTRLKPRVFQMGDLKVLDAVGEQSWVDKETGVVCAFWAGADGVERCLPALDTNPLFSDAQCRKPVLLGPARSADQTIRYVAVAGSSSCNGHVYHVGASPSGTGPIYYVNAEGSCARQADRVPSDRAVYGLEEVPLDMFVATKRVSRPRAPHMDAQVREGDDGSFEVVGFIDPARKQPCFGLGLDVSPPLCVPGWQETGDVFDGPDCTQHVGFDQAASTCPNRTNAALLRVDRQDLSCRDRSITAIWEIARTVRTPIYVKENGICALNGGSAEATEVLLAGAPIDLGSLPKLEVIDVGNGPLKVRFYGFEGVPFLPAPGRFDYRDKAGPFIEASTGEWCDPYPFADGQWRCVPSSFEVVPEFQLRFASADCTGVRLFESIVLPYCSDKAREKRGLVVGALLRPVPGYDQIVGAFGVTGKVSPPVISMGPPVAVCTSRSTGGSYYAADRVLNPADVFSSLERKMEE